MAKYKSTAAYRAADTLNKDIKAVYNAFGPDSEVYELYVNKITASLPAGAVHVSKGGFIQVTKSKTSGLTAAQLKKAKHGLPGVKRAKQTYKRQVAEENLAEKGNINPSESQIQREAKNVTDEDVQKYIDAKTYVKQYEDSKHKLKYDASVADLMKTPGAKSYELLMAILQEGEKRNNAEAQKEATNAAAVEDGYKRNKANIAD